jgi:hypothetical protein
MRAWIAWVIIGLAGALIVAAVVFLPGTLYFPAVDVKVPGGMRIAFVRPGERESELCIKKAEVIAGALRASCPSCDVKVSCEHGASEAQKEALSRSPLAVPSARRADEALTLTFHAADPALAEAVCRESEKASAKLPAQQRLTCFAAGAARDR